MTHKARLKRINHAGHAIENNGLSLAAISDDPLFPGAIEAFQRHADAVAEQLLNIRLEIAALRKRVQ